MSSELATKSGDEIFEEISRRVDASLDVDSSPTSLPIPTVSTTTSLDEVPLYKKSGDEIFEEISRMLKLFISI